MNSEFLERIQNHFPNERLTLRHKSLSDLVENCTATSHAPLLAIKVINEAEITFLLSLANKFQIPLYPISTGNNWGYGSRSPYKKDCVLVDLSLMNKITAFDEKTGVITVEPGVTQQQLHRFLSEKNAPFLTPTTGAGPNGSILGNALEHGFGLTPEADHCLAIMNLEAILPDGSLYRSDFAENGATDLDRNFKWSIGPYLDGIFTQSNFGIVTSMTIALAYRPSDISAFYFTLKSENDFERAVEVVQEIMQRFGGIVGGINLMNVPRIVSMVQKSPSDQALSADLLKKYQNELSLGDWTGVGTLYCEKEISKAVKKEIKKRLSPFCKKAVFLNRQQVQRIESFLKLVPRFLVGSLLTQLQKVKESLDIFEGKPSAAALSLVFWRSKQARDTQPERINPDNDDIGLIWYAPVIAADPKKLKPMVEMMTEICLHHQIDPMITLTAFNSRVFDITLPILFNRKDPIQVQNAHRCYADLFQAGSLMGSRPYRVGVQGSELAIQENRFWKLQLKIKQALDPNNILSPGRYSLDAKKTEALDESHHDKMLRTS
jgi:FAD/FMN-containing dehydrogenase